MCNLREYIIQNGKNGRDLYGDAAKVRLRSPLVSFIARGKVQIYRPTLYRFSKRVM